MVNMLMIEVGGTAGQPGLEAAPGSGSVKVGCWETQFLFLPQLVMRYWEPVPRGPVLWEARAEPWATWVPLLCFVLHVISWLLIFSILLVFDYAELMGLKQVRLPDPYPRHLILSRIPLSPPRMSLCLPLSSTCLLFLSPSPPFLIRQSPPSPPSKARNHGLLGPGKVHGPEMRVRDLQSQEGGS